MNGVQTERQMEELPPLQSFHRAYLLGEGRMIYVADHKSPANLVRDKTFEWLYRDGTAPIPNTYWSMIATLTEEELGRIENPDIREETRKAQELMLAYPAQFVGLSLRGNRILEEPHGFGVKILDNQLRTGDIEVYAHDVNKIIIGTAQERYNNARLWVDQSAKVDDIRFAVRYGDWYAYGRRFHVDLDYEPRYSSPHVAGLGFRHQGNHAYVSFNVNKALEELAVAEERIRAVRDHLK